MVNNNMFDISFIDRMAARRLKWFLKAFLGLEIIIDLVLLAYGTTLDDGEALVNPHKNKLIKII